MWAIFWQSENFKKIAAEKLEGLKKVSGYTQFRLIGGFVLLLVALLICLNTIPLMYFRDVLASEKERALRAKAMMISSSLAPLSRLSGDSVLQVLDILDLEPDSRTVVSNEDAVSVYDNLGGSRGKLMLFPELLSALDKNEVFRGKYEGGVFYSKLAVPIFSSGKIVGTVYLSEKDEEMSKIISTIQGRFFIISLAVCALAIFLAIVMSRGYWNRMRNLSAAISLVRDGDYEHRIHLEGRDELKMLANEFNELTERLQETDAVRRRFVSDASHELKTPLSAITLLSDSIVQNEDMDSDTLRDFVADISKEASRLSRTSEKLLSLSRLDGAVESPKEKIELGSLIADVSKTLRPLAEKKNIEIKTDCEKNLYLFENSDELFQVLFNLIENALKYSNDSGEVIISAEKLDKTIKISVADRGMGIDDEEKELVFGRFYRVDKARSRESGGSGLGLSIVQSSVEAMGGSIELKDNPGGGSIFELKLRAYDSDREEGVE